ncbi:di-/tri- peptidase [Pyramidobacter piscolens]|uniref:Peptidase M20 n=1 Tax=Pyramidobacter piscolens W5455 TaxID=352165 RepID=A0ABM9ZT24_9BACT|nr:di-/tri- peptidase [Pyramidobacter piscolens]EFB90013.1 hypothetical protein HMPREF7215_1116 [Pyramidobacter piscolens W5455]
MKDIVEDFLELVQIDAASGNERGVADAVKGKLGALGLAVEEDDAGAGFGGNAGNVLAVLDSGLPGSILLNAHMDRVANG